MSNTSLATRLALLSDTTRIRLLVVLEAEELGVGELAKALQLAQSTVSRHLKVLFDGGWLARRSEGTANYFRMAVDALGSEDARLWEVVREQVGTTAPFDDDLRRARGLVALRDSNTETFFARHAGRWDGLRADLFGDDFFLPTLLALLPTDMDVGDLGCGTGDVVAMLAPSVRTVVGIDREPAMIDVARQRTRGMDNVMLHAASLDAIPLEDQSLDAAMLMLVLHHVPSPEQVFAEVARILRPGGALVVLDMQAHDRHEYRRTMGHRHLGFSRDDISAAVSATCLRIESWRPLDRQRSALAPPLFVSVLRRLTQMSNP